MFTTQHSAPAPPSPRVGIFTTASTLASTQSPPTSSTSSAGSSTGAASSGGHKGSRLRGLTYLKNYTQNHLLSRDHSTSTASSRSLGSTSTTPLQPQGQGAQDNNPNHKSHQNHQNHHHTRSNQNHNIPHNPDQHDLVQTQSQPASYRGSRPTTSSITRSVSYSPTSPTAPTTTTTTTTKTTATAVSTSTLQPYPNHRFSLIPASATPRTLDPHPPRDPLLAVDSPNTPSNPSPPLSSSLPISTVSPSAATAASSTTASTRPSLLPHANGSDTTTPSDFTTLSAAPTPTPSSAMTRTRSATASDAAVLAQHVAAADALPSIRFSTFYDPRATRPSLTFSPISRTLPTGGEVIRVGRYSERDAQPQVPMNVPSAAPVGFKSKVVSRRHCEFWNEGGKWYIKDVKSSSGTFLNHIRLSPPGTESKPFAINDGDIVQLGIDFKGGEEMIFRCVKMRLELNRGWQSKLNAFNMTTHKRLRNMTRSSEGNGSAQTSQDCSICLNSIAPCQCLFVAPCSHTWHYKCIRSLLSSPQYPIFICPNCRAAADLEAEVEDPEEWEQLDSDMENGADAPDASASEGASAQAPIAAASSPFHPPPSAAGNNSNDASRSIPPPHSHALGLGELDETVLLAPPTTTTTPSSLSALSPGGQSSHATSNPVPIPRVPSTASAQRLGGSSAASEVSMKHTGNTTPSTGGGDRQTRTPSPTGNGPPGQMLMGAEGPITPRNDAGPWVFDGSGVRMRVAPPTTAAATAIALTTGEAGATIPPIATGQMSSLDDIARP